jgi:hypothetical protein
MGFEIRGLDEAHEELQKMIHGLTEEGLNEHCNDVKIAAKRICGLSDNDIVLQAKKVGDQITIEFSLKDRQKLSCVKQAIQEVLPSMPVTTSPLFDQLAKQIDKEEERQL